MKLKVCGMKYQTNIIEVAHLRPDYLGFIFYEDSPRNFTGFIPEISKEIKKIGVFVNTPMNNIIEKIRTYNLDIIQLHGQESPGFCSELKTKVPSLEIIKVFSIKDEFNFEILMPFESVCDYYLFDTKGKLPGGNGYAFDWAVLSKYPSSKPFFLSGGIGLDHMENIKSFLQSDASRFCSTIDVNSRFEIKPGMKDVKKLSEFKSQL